MFYFKSVRVWRQYFLQRSCTNLYIGGFKIYSHIAAMSVKFCHFSGEQYNFPQLDWLSTSPLSVDNCINICHFRSIKQLCVSSYKARWLEVKIFSFFRPCFIFHNIPSWVFQIIFPLWPKWKSNHLFILTIVITLKYTFYFIIILSVVYPIYGS